MFPGMVQVWALLGAGSADPVTKGFRACSVKFTAVVNAMNFICPKGFQWCCPDVRSLFSSFPENVLIIIDP